MSSAPLEDGFSEIYSVPSDVVGLSGSVQMQYPNQSANARPRGATTKVQVSWQSGERVYIPQLAELIPGDGCHFRTYYVKQKDGSSCCHDLVGPSTRISHTEPSEHPSGGTFKGEVHDLWVLGPSR